MLNAYYRGKKVLITGHTGFKGSWLCRILHLMGARVYGYSLEPPTSPSLYTLLQTNEYVIEKIADISDYDLLYDWYSQIKPDVVFHLAAQPLVREGYRMPRQTYLTNVMGTVNILECVRLLGAESFINVTTDKVYYNDESGHSMSEEGVLDGFDPYSNSKSCSELVTRTYSRSYPEISCPITTVRAGNVIGGGDFALDRIVPDCVRAAINNDVITVRNPNSVRPYQHVLEPLYAYLYVAAKQAKDHSFAGSYNIGPNDSDCITTGKLADLFCSYWGNTLTWISKDKGGPHEANFLKLNTTLLKETFSLIPVWDSSTAVKKVVEWTKVWKSGGNILKCVDAQIDEYFKCHNDRVDE